MLGVIGVILLHSAHSAAPEAAGAFRFPFAYLSRNKGKIEGTKWTSIPSVVKGKNLPGGILGLEFGKDGTLTYRIVKMSFQGSYIVGGANRVTLFLEEPLAGSKTHVEDITVDGDRLTMTDSDGTALTFEKER